jgi:hypothetical protein
MSQEGILNFLNVNRSLTNLNGEVRQFRLPRISPFPKLNSRVVRPTTGGETHVVSRPVVRGTVIIDGASGLLPEMATDVIDTSASYAVENVKRERSQPRPWSRTGLGHLVGRMLGNSHRAARP